MSSNLTSEYEIQLQIKDDTTDAIRALERGFKDVGNTVKKDAIGKDLTKNLEESQKAAQGMIEKYHEMARNYELDFQSISKAYSKNAGKAIAELEKQYVGIKDQFDAIKTTYEANERQIEYFNKLLNDGGLELETRKGIYKQLNDLEEQQRKSNYEQLKAQIKQNREIRAGLKAAEQSARLERADAKYEKLKELQAKRSAEKNKNKQKELDEEIKKQKALIKSIEQAEKVQQAVVKQQNAMTMAIQQSTKEESRFMKVLKGVGQITQFTYNVAGMVGGAARTAKAVAGAGIGIARQIGAGISAVAGGANDEVERERQANRIKGFDNPEERVDIMRQIYVRTGADYSAIVDAIGRVQGLLGRNLSKDELVSAAAIEVRYPGMSQAFASSTSEANPAQFQRYANRMRAMQHATGASDEQIQASTQAFANMKPGDFGSASITELQTVYLELQNSGAFDSQEELDQAFRGFVRKQRDSGEDVFKAAQNYNWGGHISGERNRLQAQNTLQNIDWGSIGASLNKTDDTKAPEMSKAETMAMRMREIEEKKNQLLMKLIPAVLPVVEGIARLMESKGDKIVKGMMALFETVIPLLEPVFEALDAFLGFMSRTILPNLQWLIEKVAEFFDGEKIDKAVEVSVAASENTTGGMIGPKYANGGIALGPSLVGEMGPEAIIPLDYSRAQRAENIAYSIQNNFSMSGNQTTALALAEAVSSRDFSRAMGRAAFKAGRMGAF